MRIEHTICPSCSIGCGIDIISIEGKAIATHPYRRHPINEGKTCKNGREAYKLTKNRLKHPQLKTTNGIKKISWEEAIITLTKKISSKQDETCIITSGAITNEEAQKLSKLAEKLDLKIGLYSKFPQLDYPQINIESIEKYKKIFVMGDIINENPLLGRRILKAKDKGANITAIDTKTTRTTINSTKHYKVDKKILNVLNDELTENSLIIFNKTFADKTEDIMSLSRASGADFVPVFEECNTRGVMEYIPPSNEIDGSLLWIIDPLSKITLDNIKGEFVIFQGTHPSKLSSRANLILPTALWCEKHGSYTNTLGMVQKFQKIFPTPDNILEDSSIFNKIIQAFKG